MYTVCTAYTYVYAITLTLITNHIYATYMEFNLLQLNITYPDVLKYSILNTKCTPS